MAENVLVSRPDLEAAKARRAGLHRACSYLHTVLTPADRTPPDPTALVAGVAELAYLWERHIHTTEAPDGLLEQITADAPRLATTVARFRRDHPAISARINTVREMLEAAELDVGSVRQQLITLLAEIERHRRGGGELIYHAYNVDLGDGE